LAVSAKPGGTSFNPLLIFGGVGLGKTHLAHAIGVEIKEKYQDKTVLYIAAEKFTQQYIEAVKKNTRNDFIHFYQLLDVLIIDDVQFLSGKNRYSRCILSHLQSFTSKWKTGNTYLRQGSC
jgi:chromosomal replication initiator protein